MLEFMLVLCSDTSRCEVTHVVLVLCFPWVSHDARHLTSCVYQISVVPVLFLSLILNDVSIVCSLFISENSCCVRIVLKHIAARQLRSCYRLLN